MIKKLFIVIVIVLSASVSLAATRTVSNSGGNWSSVGSWVEGAAATASDAVIVTATSGTLICDLSCNAGSMDFTGFPAVSVFSIAAGKIVTVSGNYTQALGMAVTGTGTLTINAAATINLNGVPFPGSVSLATTGTVTMGGAITGTLSTTAKPTVSLSADLTAGTVSAAASNTAITFTGAHNVACANLIFTEAQANAITWAAGTTFTVTTAITVYQTSGNNSPVSLTLKSGTASSPAFLVYQGTQSNSVLAYAAFTDVDASGGNPLYVYHAGTLTRTASIYNLVPPVGTGSVY